ncbi:hypothetical protein PM082_002379 [Marasmius tenuissimus]|nr:hypothetical protein PM082_002379 [Marasmius tenuissimus]
MNTQPTEIVRHIFLEAVKGERLLFEACTGMEKGYGTARTLRKVCKEWRDIAEGLPIWHRLTLRHIDHRKCQKEDLFVFLGECLHLAKRSGRGLEVTLEVKADELRDHEDQLTCEALRWLAKQERQWASFSYASWFGSVCELVVNVLESLRQLECSWLQFDLKMCGPFPSADGYQMIDICREIGRMRGLEKLGLAMDKGPFIRPWTCNIPTTVPSESRWNWLQELEVDGSSSLCLMIVVICPSVISAALVVRYEEEVETIQMIVTGNLQRLRVTAVGGEAARIFRALTSPVLEGLEVDLTTTMVPSHELTRMDIDALVGYVWRTKGQLEGNIWLPGSFAVELQELRGKGLEVTRRN